MSAKAHLLKLRLVVEGVELPIIACQVQVQPNSPMVAAIQIPPLAEATRFMPRSHVMVFFLDFYEAENPNLTKTGGSVANAPGPTVYEQDDKRYDNGQENAHDFVHDIRSQKYKLLFAGELMGFQWTKNATNRSVVLQCQDFSNYWDYATQFNNRDLFGPGLKAMFSGQSTNLFTDFLEKPGGAIIRILMTPSARYPKLEGLLGGVIHLLEAMGGSYYYDKKFAGQNLFFSIAELRLRLTQMITAYDKDPTAKRLMGGGYDSLFGRSIGNLGEQASFRKVINMLTSVIFHETYGQPCPLYVPGRKGNISGFSRKKIGNMTEAGDKLFVGFVSDARNMSESLKDILDLMDAFMSDAPDDPKSYEIFKKEKRNLMITLLGNVQRMCTADARGIAAYAPSMSSTGYSDVASMTKQASSLFKTAATNCGKAISVLKGAPPSAEFIKGGTLESPGVSAAHPTDKRVSDEIAKAKIALDKIPKLEANVTKVKDAQPAVLKQQIFRPDVWFSAPPRCNVIFPDQYTTLNYNRSFMQEPTRLLLKTNDEFFGEDELFDNFFFAPKAITLKAEKNTLQAILRGDILDHELFTGILPVFEKMGEFNIFAARSGMVQGKTPKIGLAQRSTNFLYFKYRFASRQLQVTGKFNPYIACGFPGLIIDKYIDLETFKLHNQLLKTMPNANGLPQPEVLELLGTHFLGNFTEVTHQVDQQQGTTMINCSYARQPEERSEFLGNVDEEISVMKKKPGQVATVSTEVASIFPPRLNSQGPKFGRITAVTEITSKYYNENFEDAKKLPVFGSKRDKKTKQLTTTAAVGHPRLAGDYGTEVADLVGDPSLIVAFLGYEIKETVVQTKAEKIDLPAEEYIRPGWYGECWSPSRISEVYYDFFNTGAITEAQQIQNMGDATSSANPFVTNDPEATLADAANENNPFSFARDQMLALTLTQNASIQQAVAFLVLTYSVIRQADFDTEQFIRSYTWRPIATMLDMFGSSDLQLDPTGTEVVQGVEGFHSRAFGPYENLFGLTTSDIESIVGITRGSLQAQKADTRKRKYDAVLAYVAQLRLSRALLG